MNTFNILDYGAAADGQTNDAPAIQRAIDACHSAGGGIVLLPAGRTVLSGTIHLKSHVNLHFAAGARLLASTRQADYTNHMLIEASDATNIALTGTGTIDGQARLFMAEELPHIFRPGPWRPRLIALTGCRNVLMRNLTVQNAPHWGLHMTGCDNVSIHGLTIRNDLKVPNCDGIDPDHCRNVRITDCHIESGDDCIVLKNTRDAAQYGPTENIIVSGCTLKSTSAAIKLGSESVSDFRNIVFANCIIHGSNRGLAIQLRDEGNVENVLFANMIIETRLFHEDWWGQAEPIYVTAFPRTPETKVGAIRHIRFANIIARGETGAYLAAAAPDRLEDVVLDNVRLEVGKSTRWRGGRYDRRPGFGDVLFEHKIAGVFCDKARDITLHHCRIAWGATRPDYYGHALEVHRVTGLKIEEFIGESAHPERDAPTLID